MYCIDSGDQNIMQAAGNAHPVSIDKKLVVLVITRVKIITNLFAKMPESSNVHNNIINLEMDATNVELKYAGKDEVHGVMDTPSNSHSSGR